jgi:leader peptidase (prepilin peptidase) / N-methyltransferase
LMPAEIEVVREARTLLRLWHGKVPRMAVLFAFVALVGLAVGSLLNLVIDWVPRGESSVAPPSQRPAWEKPARNRYNIPVLGWLMLKDGSADCRRRISIRYPLIEMLTGLLFLAVAVRIHGLDRLPALPAYLYFVGVGIVLAFIDIELHRLPNVLVLPSYPVVAVLLAGGAAWQHDWSSLLRAGEGGAVLYAFYFALVFTYPAGMGFGDVKLAGLLGGLTAYLSWSALLIGAFGGFLLGAVVGIIVLTSGRGTRKSALPFGPFMIVGALIAIFASNPIADAYLNLSAFS